MGSFLINGGVPLRGKVEISGSKNSALPIMAACLMADGKSVLKGVPRLSDVDWMTRLMGDLGCHVYRHEPGGSTVWEGPPLNGPLDITVADERRCEASYDIVQTMRASICVLGPLLAKRGRAIVSYPGGCDLGNRPIDLHLRGLAKLGAEFRTIDGTIIGEVRGRLKGRSMYLGGTQGPTVLGTINVMCAAALAEGQSVIIGAACEPEVSDCANFLNKMGACITGQGTPEIRIEGVEHLTGAEHRIIPDRIELGTFIMAAAITGGELELKHCNIDHLAAVTDRLEDVGVKITRQNGTVFCSCPGRPHAVEIATQPYPGFPTDLQAQMMALLSLADGNSVITERIFPDRFHHVGELMRMGAQIRRDGSKVVVEGVTELQGTSVKANDLRASAALVLAGLVAKGTTRLECIHHIDRGYEKIEQKLAAVGARIQRIEDAAAAAA